VVGLVTGVVEVAILWGGRALFGGFLRSPRDLIWMAPVTAIATFGAVGVTVIALARRRGDETPLGLAVGTFAVLAFFDLLLLYTRLHHYASVILAAGLAVQAARLLTSHPRWLQALLAATFFWVPARRRGPDHGRAPGDPAERDGALIERRQVLVGTAWRWPARRRGPGLAGDGRAAGADRTSAASRGAPNVLLIVMDTVRAHNLSLYGYPRSTTPNLQRLANEGATFTQALSTAPWTLPSHASMFTGRYPHELSTNWARPLDSTYPTLAEVLSGHGFRAAGFVANTGYCSHEHGLSRGFTDYQDYRISLGQFALSLTAVRVIADNYRVRRLVRNDEHLNRQPADLITASFLGWLSTLDRRPFFAFVNYYDAHDPFLPPPPFDRRFGPGRRLGKYSALPRTNWDPAENHRPLTPDELREEIDAYDGALAYIDHHVGLVLAELRRRGLLEDTLVIVTSDHGEEFAEHRVYGHGNSLYLPSVHVPLVLAFPGRAPAGIVVDEPVTLRDLPATVMDLVALERRPQFPGRSLARFWRSTSATEAGEESPLLAEVRQVSGRPSWFPATKGDMRSLVAGGFRYIRNGDGTEELYDFDRDPGAREPGRGAGPAPTWTGSVIPSRPEERAGRDMALRRRLARVRQWSSESARSCWRRSSPTAWVSTRVCSRTSAPNCSRATGPTSRPGITPFPAP
jgi:arylsulfatase A-like enzyme